MSLRLILATLLYPVACSVPAGIGAAIVLAVPELAPHARLLLPYVGAESFVLGAAIAWHVAATMLREPRPAAKALIPVHAKGTAARRRTS